MTIQHDPVLSNAYIRDVTQRSDLDPTDNDNPPKLDSQDYYQDSPGVNITITSGDSMIVAYKGTSRDQDWIDNGKGGASKSPTPPARKRPSYTSTG